MAKSEREAEQEKLPEREYKKERLAALQNRLRPLLEELSEKQIALSLLGGNPHWTYCVYEDFLREKIDTQVWWERWGIPKFEEYHDWVWVEELMRYASYEHFLILGYAPCIDRLLKEHAAKLRSVKWIMQREQYIEAVQDFIDEFYEEYGLAVSLQLLEPGEGWARVRPCTSVAVTVLDFTGEEKLSACDVARGSVWLDMDALEGKERRMEVRCPQITYFSLKKHWKQLQKEPGYLDTIGKNRYNT